MREEQPITGMMVYYAQVCKRKLFYFSHQLCMEQNNEYVALGALLDEKAYPGEEKHITIDDTISVDFIRKGHILHEVKKSKAIEEASIWQLKYYLYYLQKKGMTGLSGQIDYPLLKQTVAVTLSEADCVNLEALQREIRSICQAQLPPPLERTKQICRKCAYYDLCFV